MQRKTIFSARAEERAKHASATPAKKTAPKKVGGAKKVAKKVTKKK